MPCPRNSRVLFEVLCLLRDGLADEFVLELERNRFAALFGRQRRATLRRYHDQRNRLKIGATLAAGLEPRLFELPGDVVNRKFLAAAADASALQHVARQIFHIGANAIRIGRFVGWTHVNG